MAKLPKELHDYMTQPWTAPPMKAVKADIQQVFLLNCEPLPDRCSNCGGQGHIYAFFSYSGPHEHAHGSPTIASKWVNGGWYYGAHRSFPCPVCSPDSTDHVDQHQPPPPVEEQPPLEYEDYTK